METAIKAPEFVHLRLHTEYSISDGLVRVKPLIQSLVERGMPAIGVTDRANFYGLIKLYKAADTAGIKLIVGADLCLRSADDPDSYSTLCLLAMNDQGYRNLTLLISDAYLQGQYHGLPLVDRKWLHKYGEDLIVLSGGSEGEIGQALINGREDLARNRLQEWMELFPQRFYLELHRTGHADDENHVHAAVALASELGCPVVATNNVRFLEIGRAHV